ncbi:hypothetical protein GCM10007989_20650 [Devosia pacifica]|uniref:N-acetyltransferase domain-containing protein n=1 Tax=Devosia pacifica TaxID=1335967 RepID=A0A918S7Q2_9HYPH|nr:GNAT family N-acetyltransferase [Devosia pacifica]GHA24864.1 hypothetical protein GCM10007989_20650 [Devosia pacifica]
MISLRERLPSKIDLARLVLSPPTHADVGRLSSLVNNWNVARWTASIPHPYAEADMIEYLEQVVPAREKSYAIRGQDGEAMGVVSLMFDGDKLPELGYWLAEPYWGQGYTSEAVVALLAAVRDADPCQAINARVLVENHGSTRVLEKAGFKVVERTLSVIERHRDQPLLILRWTP